MKANLLIYDSSIKSINEQAGACFRITNPSEKVIPVIKELLSGFDIVIINTNKLTDDVVDLLLQLSINHYCKLNLIKERA